MDKKQDKGIAIIYIVIAIALAGAIIGAGYAIYRIKFSKIDTYAERLSNFMAQINQEISKTPRPQLPSIYTRYDVSPNNLSGGDFFKSAIIHNGDKTPLYLKFDNTILEIDNISVATTSKNTFGVQLDGKLNDGETRSMRMPCMKDPGPTSCHGGGVAGIVGRQWDVEISSSNGCQRYNHISEYFLPLSVDFDFATGKWNYIEIGQLLFSMDKSTGCIKVN